MLEHDEREQPAAPSPGDGRQRRRPAGPPLAVVVPWVVAALATAVAVGLFLQRGDDRTAEDVAAVEETAGAFALRLTTWDATDGMADTREALREAATASFAAEVDELFGGSDDLAGLEQLGARSEAEVVDLLVTSVDADTAEALAVVVQRVTTEVTEGAEVSERYARITLARDGDRWRVDDLELAVDLLQEAAERVPGAQLPGLDLDPDGEDGTDGPSEDATEEEP